MPYTLKKLDQSQVELKITVAPVDYQKDLEAAAVRLSERAAIKGFRAGKAPYAIVKEQLGEIKILEEALQTIVELNYFRTVQEEKLDTIGRPEITIEKMAPGNDFVFKAKVALLPSVKLPDFTTIKVDKKKIAVGDKEVDAVIHDLRKMRMKEVIKAGAATKDDKIVVDMDMFLDKIPLEGGQAKGHQIYLSEPHYIPGMAEQLLGLKSGDEKEFALKFPDEHYNKLYAGKNVDIKVKVKDVYELTLPEIDDEFVKTLGQESVAKLRDLLLANLTHEAEHKEDQRLEQEILEKAINATEFGEIPEVLIKSEKQKMFSELKHDLEQRGISFEKYLADIKKTEEQIYTDFTENATKRAKAALISRAVAQENGIVVSDEELKKELELIKSMYQGDELKRVEENIKRPEVKDTIAATIQNKKVVEWMKEKICPGSATHNCHPEEAKATEGSPSAKPHDHSAPGHKCDHC
ncbi:MAG: trigger factor [Candidatus Magasanikbacteria bacterium]|jgi:trigger factor